MRKIVLEKKAITIIIFGILISSILLWYGYSLSKRVMNVEKDWSEYNYLAASSSYELSRISVNFGGGSFLHHFKNYILRRDVTRLPLLKENLHKTYQAIDRYLTLPITTEERQALLALKDVVDNYAEKIETARQLFAQGMQPIAVDVQIRVDDQPAFDAIDQLARISLQRSEQKEFETQVSVQNTIDYLHYGIWMVPIILFGVAIILVFLHKLVAANIQAKKAKQYLSDLLAAIPDAMLSVDARGKIVRVNSQACELFGYTEPELLLLCIEDLLPEKYRDRHHSLRQQYFDKPRMRPMGRGMILYAATKSGEEVPVEISLSFMEQNGEKVAIATVRDISERVNAETKMRQASTVFENTDEAIVIANADCNIVTVNNAFTSITGFKINDVIGQHVLEQYQIEQNNHRFDELSSSLERVGRWRGELLGKRHSGEQFPAWLTISVVKDINNKIVNYIAVFSDISAIKQTEEWLTHLAHHDALTQLPNRSLFTENLQQAIQQAKRHNQEFALLFLDLDRFKIINDTLGHACGDKLLKVVAERLKNCVRGEDTVARLGGDEFTVILREVSHSEDVAKVAAKIISKLSQPISIDGREVVSSTSVGISIYPNDAVDIESLAKAADSAMYRAKEQGRNNYQFYSAELTQKAFERLSLEQGLRQALNRDEFVLFYQPQVSIDSGEIVGVEALIRWLHPEMGLVPPFKFIPIAEETGLIQPIGEWVIHTACAQARQWRENGLPPIRIAVNISARQMLDEASLIKLEEILETLNLNQDGLQIDLEITESDLRIAEQSIDTLNRLKAKGVGLAIDDFGTGYSSLSRLKQLPIDTLKIDRSFVKDIPNDPDDEAIASAVISMGRSLNLKVIGEGVETQEQLNFLRRQGCDEMQGYLYSKPVPADDVAQLFVKDVSKIAVGE